MSSLGENTMCFGENTMCFGENTCVFKSVFIFPINLRIARKYFGDVTYLRTIFQIEDSFVFQESMSGLARATAILFLSRPSSSFTAVHSHRHFRHFATAQPFTTATSSTSSSSMTPASKSTILPPLPRRDEERVVYAGIGPNTRQSNDSTEPLMDPPVSIHDPYGWMRDDDRTDEEVLTYLKAENEYSKAMTEHLGGLQAELYDEFLSR